MSISVLISKVNNFLDFAYSWIWALPMLLLLLGIGFYLTYILRAIQFRKLPYALRLAFGDQKKGGGEGDISHFASLMTALAATIGIGNIAGVATAITVGGMGALFWMWVTALIGMAIKYAEAVLAVRYRVEDSRGEMCGGPMYFISQGLGWKGLATSFAILGAIGAFGGGNMLQSNAVADVMQSLFDCPPWISGVLIALCTGLTLLGGIKSIGTVASFLVPIMAILYIGGALLIALLHFDQIPGVLATIFTSAFTGQAATGGFAGASVLMALRVGISRGLMTSEAGLGTASIAAAAAKTDYPSRQALVSMCGGFLSTVVMCSATGLALGVTHALGLVGPNGKLLTGASLTVAAFNSVFPWGGYLVAFGLVLFALTTIIGWAYYGEKCCEYLLGIKVIPAYRLLFTGAVIAGAVLELDLVWKLSDVCNGLMAIPNLIGLCALACVVKRETVEFEKILAQETE